MFFNINKYEYNIIILYSHLSLKMFFLKHNNPVEILHNIYINVYVYVIKN